LHIAGVMGIIYLTWATGSFFEKKKLGNYLKALTCYLLGMMTFLIFILALGITIDLIKN
jgi:nitrate/nitrite transporter NarK